MGVDDVLCTQVVRGRRIAKVMYRAVVLIVGLIFPHVDLASDAMEYSNRFLARC